MRTTIPVSIQSADNGTFESAPLDTIGLRSGTYKIEVEPQSKQYKDLVSTTYLMVNPHPWTIEETVSPARDLYRYCSNFYWLDCVSTSIKKLYLWQETEE